MTKQYRTEAPAVCHKCGAETGGPRYCDGHWPPTPFHLRPVGDGFYRPRGGGLLANQFAESFVRAYGGTKYKRPL